MVSRQQLFHLEPVIGGTKPINGLGQQGAEILQLARKPWQDNRKQAKNHQQHQNDVDGDHHTFQFGGKGSALIEAYFEGSDRIARYPRARGSQRRRWDPPALDGEYPESEWGFEPALRKDVERFAQDHGYRVRQIMFQDPQDLSPLVADLYHWWYQQRGPTTS